MNDLDKKAIANIRVLTMEMITGAKSGHPGIALGASPILHTLYTRVLKQVSFDSKWFNRDRFVLAAGHGSSLLYAALHLSGYKLTIDDLKDFRKIGSLTPGHPELNHTDGVDATSGPLGQGIPMAVGLAISERFLASKYNQTHNDIEYKLFDNYTYVLCGDGDLQEGVTVEALSLAGNQRLNKLIILYDSNDIQLDGKVINANTENTKKKVEAMNINYLYVADGENTDDIYDKIMEAKQSDKPTLIEIKTIIGKTAKNENTSSVHGSPLSPEEVLEMRKNIGGEPYEVFPETRKLYEEAQLRNKEIYNKEKEVFNKYMDVFPADYMEIEMFLNNKDFLKKSDFQIPFNKDYAKATRNSAGEVLNSLSGICPIILGGSADLTKSTCIKGSAGDYNQDNLNGRNICFGVREHAMAAICNGITLNGITRAFCGGFFVFSDYMKPSIRMSALMGLPVMYFFTHDSIAVGEDGPTHEPIEQLTMLRAIPNLNVMRPCGLEETKEAITIAYNSKNNPTAIILSRQGMKEPRTENNSKLNLSELGAYVISKETNKLDAIILATGSEVALAIEASSILLEQGISVRVVSMPSMFLFDKQPLSYKLEVLPNNIPILGLEMSEGAHLYKYIQNGKLHNINSFGLSGKANEVLKAFKFTPEDVAIEVITMIKK